MMDYSKVQSRKQMAVQPLAIEEYFSIGPDVISLGIGEPDFHTPEKAGFAAIAAIVNGATTYPPSMGLLELRRALSDYMGHSFNFDYAPDEILITVGGSLAIDSVMRAFVEEGDEVILPTPTFPSYFPAIEMAGGRVVEVPTQLSNGWALQPEDLRAAITERTKLLVLTSPNNPTGACLSAENMAALADVLRDTNVLVMSDEIYAELTYNDQHASILDQPDMRERTILVSGFSKMYAMTGWRVGYVCAPAELLRPIAKCHSFAVMCAPGIAQYAALEGLKSCKDNVRIMVEEYRHRRDFVQERLCQLGWQCSLPGGAFYAFPCIRGTGLDSATFCRRLRDEGKVAMVPGTGFGQCGEGYVRISYAYHMDALKAAFDRIDAFCARL